MLDYLRIKLDFMSQVKSIERLSSILNFVHHNPYCSLQEMMNNLSNKDYFPTERTMQRDLKTIREICFIEIKYNRLQNGYYIDQDSERDFNEWMQIFELFNRANVINEVLLKTPGTIEFIDFDQSVSIHHEQLFPTILNAIIERRKIRFTYSRYWEDEAIQIQLEPQLLKEYLNRWYVVGTNEEGEFRSYGIERITQFELLATTFFPKVKNPKALFYSVIGLYSENELEQVVLSYQPFQGKYIKSQPLHSSQTILIDNDTELRIELRVCPNYELEEQILKQGERVTVVKPEWLRESIKHRIIRALMNY
jgi:predicted DNA-binding transcriptional regulator YafY